MATMGTRTAFGSVARRCAAPPSSATRWTALRAKSSAASASASSASSSTAGDDFVLPHIQLGPTHASRYREHYDNTLAEDLLYMTYDHNASLAPAHADASSAAADATPPHTPTPYELNRPAPAPRGNRPVNPATTHDVPQLTSIILHTMVKEAIGNKPALLTAIMALRAISGETAHGGGRAGSSGVQVVVSKSGAAAFKLRAGMPVAAKVELKGDAMYTFIQSLVDFVLPRIREFPGFPLPPSAASTLSPSAASGVVSLGLPPTAMALFPQVEVNLDAYPRMHGFHMQFQTNARGKDAQDKARALLSGFRIPFYKR